MLDVQALNENVRALLPIEYVWSETEVVPIVENAQLYKFTLKVVEALVAECSVKYPVIFIVFVTRDDKELLS